MIVVDTNVIAALFLERPDSDVCRRAVARDRACGVPPLWRSEFLSVLRHEMHWSQSKMPLESAREVFHDAAQMFGSRERAPSPDLVLELCRRKKLMSYDAEFLALAEELDAKVVTGDVAFVKSSKGRAVTPQQFLDEG